MSQLFHQDPRIKQSLYGPSLSVDLYRHEINRVCEAFWMSPDYDLSNLDEYCKTVALNESSLITEIDIGGAIKGQLTNLLQAAIGFAAEAGITAAGIGTTAPAGVAAETLTDCFFAVGQVGSFVSSMSGLASMAGDLWQVVKDFFTMSLGDGLSGIYDATRSLINAAGALFEKIGLKITEGLEKLKELIGGMLKKASAAAADFISMLIPGDAGVTGATIQGIADAMAEEAFGVAEKIYGYIPDWAKQYWEDPGKMEEFLTAGATMLIDFLKKGTEAKDQAAKAGVKDAEGLKQAAKEDKEGFMDSVGDSVWGFMKTGAKVTAGLAFPPLGIFFAADSLGITDAIIAKVAKFVEGTVLPGIPKAVEMFHQVVPFFVAGLSCFTIIMKEDFDFEVDEEGTDEEGDDSEATPSGEPPATGKARLSHKEEAAEDLSHLGFEDIKQVAVQAVRDLRANESKKYSLNIIWDDVE